jgi:signal transduction histidine kinase/DNA-binding response OmpR family regulator
MSENNHKPAPPRVIVIADVESNAQALVNRVLRPAGIQAWTLGSEAPPPDVFVLDITQLRGDPLAGLRDLRASGDIAPAIVIAAHFPNARLRDMFRLGVGDVVLKPYRPEALCQAIFDLHEVRSPATNTKILAQKLETMRDELQQRSEEIRLLSEIGRVVVNLGDLDAILRRVVEAAAFVTNAEEASIYMIEPESNELVLRACKLAGRRHATLQRLRADHSIVGEVLSSGQPVLRQPSLESGPLKIQTGFLVRSMINAPIWSGNRVIGVLGVYNQLASRAFGDHHLTLLVALAHWAGVALEQASLLHRARSGTTNNSTLTAAPVNMIDGLDRSITILQALLESSTNNMTRTQRAALNELHNQMSDLRAMPMATLHPTEAEEMVDLSSMMQQITKDLQPTAKGRGIELVTEYSTGMPWFHGDGGRIRRIIDTLVTAAIRRTKRGHIALEAHRTEVRNGESSEIPLPEHIQLSDGFWVVVRVSDSSPGLTRDTVRALSAHDTDPALGQIGPGLSLGEIRIIVESMGGIIWHEHTPASTSILFALPMK